MSRIVQFIGNGRVLRVALQNGDRGHLEKMKVALKSSHPIKIKSNLGRKYAWLCIASVPLTAPLEGMGWHEFKKKGNIRILEAVPEKYRISLIRGLIDGDGCIFHEKERQWRWRLGFTDLHLSVVEWFHKTILGLGFVSKAKISQQKDHKNWNINYSNSSVPWLLGKLYGSSNVSLDRKLSLAIEASCSTRPRRLSGCQVSSPCPASSLAPHQSPGNSGSC